MLQLPDCNKYFYCFMQKPVDSGSNQLMRVPLLLGSACTDACPLQLILSTTGVNLHAVPLQGAVTSALHRFRTFQYSCHYFKQEII